MKKQLEKIYLANVILYLSSYTDLQTFAMINSKCFDALQIIKHFPYGIQLSKTFSEILESIEILQKTTKLLTNIQTIQIPNEQYLSMINYT